MNENKRRKPVIVIPTYNEKKNVIALVKRILELVDNCLVVVVDDNSPDGTATKVEKDFGKEKRVELIVRERKAGRGSAVLEGFKHVFKNNKITHFVEMDADFSHDPTELEAIFAKSENHDVVIAARYLSGSKIIDWPWQRRAFSKLANMYARLMLGVPVVDYTNGYRCYSKRALEKIGINSLKEPGYALLMEMIYKVHKKKLKIGQVETVFVNRTRGQSNTSLKEILNALNAPLRIRLRG